MSSLTFDAIVAEHATPVDVSHDRLLVLDDQYRTTLVVSGEVDLFAVPLELGRPAGRWNFLGRITRGGVIPGAPPGPRHGLLARSAVGSTLYQVATRDLEILSLAQDPEKDLDQDGAPLDGGGLVAGVEQVVDTLARSLRTELPPREFVPLAGCTPVTVGRHEAVRSVDGVQWVEVVSGEVDVAEGGTGSLGPTELICLTERDWIVGSPSAVVRARSTRELLDGHVLWPQLMIHAARTLYTIDRRVAARDAEETAALRERRDLDAATLATTATRFETLLRDTDATLRLADVAADPPARAATRLVAAHRGFTLRPAAPGRDHDSVAEIALAAHARTRSIRLDGAWWRHDLGPLVGYHGPSETPVALLRVGGRYVLAHGGRVQPVTAALAGELGTRATVLYPPLPTTVRSVAGLLRFGLAGNAADAWRFGLVALAVAAVGLLAPVMTGRILGSFVARAETGFIVQGSLLVIAAAFVVGALSVVQNISVLRIESRSTEKMQAGVWTRLLSLPASFFGRYSTGSLGTTVLGVNAAQEMLSGVVTTATLGLVTGLANLVLVYVIDVRLALVATGLLLVALGVAVAAAWVDVRRQTAVYDNEQQVAARVFQLLTAVPKLRVAAAEDRAFGVWADEFTRGRSLAASSRRVQNRVATFNAGFPIACSVVIFAVVGGPLHDTVSITTFLSFFAAFSLLIASILQFTGAAVTAIGIVPMFRKLRPLIEADPEIDELRADPGDLSGRVSLSGVSFRYDDGPVVLDDVSITVDVGEFVAVVGPSGSGKSTVLRLLLGFETPSVGSVLYDGQDLAELDVSAVRRQCGVVLQNGALLAGDIKTNIIGSTTRTVDDAWTAAEMAGIAPDIKAMPMGMNTVLSEGASALSGGQRQRIMIARALIGRPRLVLFDEATSALDNPTQQTVAESTRRLNASRVVIAHRLSTVADADKIVVLDKGRVVQQGTYDELLADAGGMFATLARRQMA